MSPHIHTGCQEAVEARVKPVIMSLQLTSITQTPDRLVSKGADFLRKGNANRGLFAHRRKSAVELLEASKSEYVKSSVVLNHKQELKHPEVLHVSTLSKSPIPGNHPTYPVSEYGLSADVTKTDSENSKGKKTPERPKSNDFDTVQRKNSSNSAHSNSSQRIKHNSERCKIPVPEKRLVSPTLDEVKKSDLDGKVRNTVSPIFVEGRKSDVPVKSDNTFSSVRNGHDRNMEGVVKEKPKVPEKPKLSEKPKVPEKPKPPVRSKDFLLPTTYQSLSTSVTVLVEKRCASPSARKSPNEPSVVRRKKTLHRSQSDLSCRHSRTSSDFSDLSSRLSRTSTELDRFFNEMGIDRCVLDPMLKLHKRKTDNSDMFESLSSIVSAPNDKSSCSETSGGDKGEKSETDKQIAERNSKQTSIVETNARIIKWLCNVNKAHQPNKQASS